MKSLKNITSLVVLDIDGTDAPGHDIMRLMARNKSTLIHISMALVPKSFIKPFVLEFGDGIYGRTEMKKLR